MEQTRGSTEGSAIVQYREFEIAFEKLLQTQKNLYPHAVEYHRTTFQHPIQNLLSSILDQTETLVQQSQASWENTEEVISEILYAADVNMQQPH